MKKVLFGVVLGVLASLLAAYLKPWINSLGGAFSRRWAERSAASAAARKRWIEWLRANPHDQQMLSLDALNSKLDGLFAIGAGYVAALILGRSFASFSWAATLMIGGGVWMIRSGDAKQRFLREARTPPSVTP